MAGIILRFPSVRDMRAHGRESKILLDKIAGFPILSSFAKHIRRFGSVLFALWRGEERCPLPEHRFRSSHAFKRACQRRRPSPCRLLPIRPPGNRNSSINCGKPCARDITAVEPSRPTAIGSNASSFSTMACCGQETKFPCVILINLIIDGSDASRRAIGAADCHPLLSGRIVPVHQAAEAGSRPREQARVYVSR